MSVNNASNDSRVHGFFLVNWFAPCPLGALNQVLDLIQIDKGRQQKKKKATEAQFSESYTTVKTCLFPYSRVRLEQSKLLNKE